MKKLSAAARIFGTAALFLLIGCDQGPGHTGPALVSITVTKQPDRTEYGKGENFDPSGLTVTGTYSDGKTREETGYTLSEPDMATAGEKKVTVTLAGKSTEFTIQVREYALLSLEVTQGPNRKIFAIGEEFDPAGLEVTGVYSDGVNRVVSGYTLSSPDMTTAGEKTITITLAGKTAAITITVSDGAVLKSITVTTPPAKILYLKDEPFESAGLVVTGAYSDGTEKPVTGFTVEAATGTAGKIAVTVRLEGISVQTWIYVTAGQLIAITVTKGPDKQAYSPGAGEALDLSGIEIEGFYSDLPTDVSFPLDASAATAGAYNDQQLGPQTLTVTLNGLSAEFDIVVRNPPSLEFDYGRRRSNVPPVSEPFYTAPLRRKLVLAPVKWFISDSATYRWELDGVVQSATGEFLTLEFKRAEEMGSHTVTVTVTDGGVSASAQTRVDCVAPEGTYRRGDKPGSVTANKVYDFTPAPGQFVSLEPSEDVAIRFAESRFSSGAYLSLGAWGGYVIAGFSRSVWNLDGNKADLQIMGNNFSSPGGGGWTEPGVIWVSQDDNGNGIPDDTWYELKGSEHGHDMKRYAVTYYKPTGRGSVWIDNVGNRGTFPGITYYGDPQGYPNHVPGDYVTFTGTGLENTVTSGGIIYNPGFEWGYVDNDPKPAHYKIENAVQADGSFIDLRYIDFVKIHTGQNARAGVLGEISTEIEGWPVGL